MTEHRPEHHPMPVSASGAQAGHAPGAAMAAVLDSQAVLRGHQAITIVHNGHFYRLQTTRQGKLILTK
ncbi:MAG: hemin uptake protein HemP [Burkholderiales bacterium]|nr:MAG: hemin uptake protein HemP [Burkholderiales bacterium]